MCGKKDAMVSYTSGSRIADTHRVERYFREQDVQARYVLPCLGPPVGPARFSQPEGGGRKGELVSKLRKTCSHKLEVWKLEEASIFPCNGGSAVETASPSKKLQILGLENLSSTGG